MFDPRNSVVQDAVALVIVEEEVVTVGVVAALDGGCGGEGPLKADDIVGMGEDVLSSMEEQDGNVHLGCLLGHVSDEALEVTEEAESEAGNMP